MKREDLPVVTPDEFKKFGPRWLGAAEGRARFEHIAEMKDEWTALDVLDLDDVSASDKLRSVLREEFLPEMLLHEFACRCAEWALSFVENPDARSVDAVRVKRLWLSGKATNCELGLAQDAAQAAKLDAVRAVELRAALAADWAADSSTLGGAGCVAYCAALAAMATVALAAPRWVAKNV